MKKGSIFLIFIIVLFLIILPFTSAAHFVIGQVDDSYDSTLADDHTIIIWNPINGISDNVTDIIGPSGNSGSSNIYMIDCELLSSSCDVGDTLLLKVLNNGDNYITETISINITGAGFDLASNLRLNTPPVVTLITPNNNANLSNSFNFICNVSDIDGNLANVSLYGNWSGNWLINETNLATGYYNSTSFSPNISEGIYSWNCKVSDSLGISTFSQNNRSFTYDPNSPIVSSIYYNTSIVCGTNNNVRVLCNVSDTFVGLDKVIIRSNSILGSQNYSASFLLGNTYYIDLLLNQEGVWNFTCFANDTFGNSVNFNSPNINVSNASADFQINSNEITFDKSSYVEGENVNVSAVIHNLGCLNTSGVITSFYIGDPDSLGIQIGNNYSLALSSYSNKSASIIWNANISINNLFVKVDINNSFSEFNEANNKANNSFNVGSWHVYYGKLNNDKILATYNLENLTYWLNESNVSGNVYVTDIESNIDWSNLYPIGRNISLGTTNNDFSEIDSILGTSYFNDSISDLYTSDGSTIIASDSFLVHHKNIDYVPIINSTNTSNFITGILWDATNDSDGQYSFADKEDLVFLTKVNKDHVGQYGTYDYEINIPVKLRNYHPENQNEVYIYFDIY